MGDGDIGEVGPAEGFDVAVGHHDVGIFLGVVTGGDFVAVAVIAAEAVVDECEFGGFFELGEFGEGADEGARGDGLNKEAHGEDGLLGDEVNGIGGCGSGTAEGAIGVAAGLVLDIEAIGASEGGITVGAVYFEVIGGVALADGCEIFAGDEECGVVFET